MSELSDLELVAQAMGTAQPPRAQTNHTSTNGPVDTRPTSSGQAGAALSHTGPPDLTDAPADDARLADLGIDLSSLSAEDRRALQPIIDALASSRVNGDEGEDVDLEGILRQMDAADQVADDLEGKLDGLLAKLEREAAEMERDAAAVQQGHGQGGQ